MGEESSLRPFLLGTLLWLPLCFAIWYFCSILFAAPLAAVETALLSSLFPEVIEGVVRNGNELTVLTLVEVPTLTGAPRGEILFDLDPQKYGYCVPLYTALVLATPGDDTKKLLRWLLGMLILGVVQTFGIAAETLKVIAFQLGEPGAMALALPSWGNEVLVLAYQLGSLILPSVVPIMLWLVQFRAIAGIGLRAFPVPSTESESRTSTRRVDPRD